MKKWNMPQGLQACVRHHHMPNCSKKFETLSFIVAFGNYLSHIHGLEADDALISKTKEIDAMIQKVNLSPENDMRLHETIVEDFQHADIFD
jgi:hypothetical protein